MHKGAPPDNDLLTPSNPNEFIDRFKDILTESTLLKGIPSAMLEKIMQEERAIRLQPGEILISPEKDNRYIYIVLEGTLTVHFGSLTSPEIRTIEQGNCTGEMSVIDQCKPSAYVVAYEPVTVFPVHSVFLQQHLAEASPIINNLMKVLTQWIRENTESMLRKSTKIVELTNHASTDALTGLYNRRWLDNSLPHFLTVAAETDQPLCLLLLDVDHFKNYNDTFGHTAGDQALRIISNTLTGAIRPQDFASRYGGEEFLILLPHTSQHEGILVAERIRNAIETLEIPGNKRNSKMNLTISIGLSVSQPNSTPKTLFDSADDKLYKAKQDGRNCIRYD